MEIAFIGGGNMGKAMLAAVIEDGLAQPEAIWVSDISQERRKTLAEQYGVVTTASSREAVSGKDIIVLAVKPQNLAEVTAELGGKLKSGQVVLSIIAGARIDTLSKGLKHNAIARAMPNTPAQIREGVSLWTATPQVSGEQKDLVAAILGAMGREIYVDQEKYLDMATAVSGSGPAYFFLMVEALVEAAVDIGLPRDIAGRLAVQTMLGSGRLIERSGEGPAELRRKVTSPGGTTARAIEQFEKGQFTELVRRAVRAAYDRARELGRS
jgi:pyrroline-5-carboxylate reductase